MSSSNKFLQTYEAYVDAFPKAVMFDSRGMSSEDFGNLENLMIQALERGSPMTEADLQHPVVEADPEQGLLT